MSDFVKIATYTLLPEAQIALGRLDAEGIEAHMTNAYMAQALPGTFVRIHVFVAPEDEARAREILGRDYSGDLEEDDEKA